MKTWKLQWKAKTKHYYDKPDDWHDLEEWSLPEHAALRLGWWEKHGFPMEFQVVEAAAKRGGNLPESQQSLPVVQ